MKITFNKTTASRPTGKPFFRLFKRSLNNTIIALFRSKKVTYFIMVFDYKTPKQIFYRLKNKYRFLPKRLIKKLKFWYKYNVLRSPVYYFYSSTDCDCVTVSGYGKAKNLKRYYKGMESLYENAEGATSMNIVPKNEWEHHGEERQIRDHIMEAYENGNGRSIIV